MEYKVELYKSVNGLGFGTDKAEVRKIMGISRVLKSNTLKKSSCSK